VFRFLNLNVNSGVIRGKSFQNTIYKWTGMLNLHVPKKWFFGEKFISESISPLKWNWAVRPYCGKVLQVIGLHDFRCTCYRRVASWSLTPLNLPCVYALFWLVSISSYVFKSPSICFQGKNMKLTVMFCLLAFYVMTPGPAVIIKTVCKYSSRFL